MVLFKPLLTIRGLMSLIAVLGFFLGVVVERRRSYCFEQAVICDNLKTAKLPARVSPCFGSPARMERTRLWLFEYCKKQYLLCADRPWLPLPPPQITDEDLAEYPGLSRDGRYIAPTKR